MKFDIKGVVLNIRDFVQKIRPILTHLLYQEQLNLDAQSFKYTLCEREEWVIKRLIDDVVGVHITHYWRRNTLHERHFYLLKQTYDESGTSMEVEFSRALLEVIPLHLIPDPLVVVYQNDCLILKNSNASSWL